MLRSYTRAINKEKQRFGSLFCRHTKAFGKLSDIPKRLRNFITPFIQHFKRGRLINFSKTMKTFFMFIKTKKDKYLDSHITFTQIFDHPSTFKLPKAKRSP